MTFEEFMDTLTDLRPINVGDHDVTYECAFVFRSRVRVMNSRWLTTEEREHSMYMLKQCIASNMWNKLKDEFRDESKMEAAYYEGYTDAKKLVVPSYGGGQ